MKKLIIIFAIITLISVPFVASAGFWDWLTPLFNQNTQPQEVMVGGTVCYPYQGCTGQDFSASTGIIRVDAGTFSITSASGDGSSNWEYSGVNALTPTSTIGIIVNASSTFASTLEVIGAITGTGGFVGALTGNADTATALAADPADCITGFAKGIGANGSSTCSSVTAGDIPDSYLLNIGDTGTGIYTLDDVRLNYGLYAATGTFTGYISALGFTGKSSTTAAFATNPTNCSANQYPLGVDASGNVESCTADANTTYTALNPVVLNGTIFGIESASTTRWETAYGWGNHALGNYWTTTSASSWLNSSSTLAIDIVGNLTGNVTGNADTATALTVNPTGCTTQFVRDIAANGTLTCESIADADVPDTITASNYLTLTAWYSTTTADIGESGNLYYTDQRVKDVINATTSISINIEGNADTATALANNPSDCSANQFAQSIVASGNLTCAAIGDADVPDTITVSNYFLRSNWFSTTTWAGGTQALTTTGIITGGTIWSKGAASSTSITVNDRFKVNSLGAATSTEFTITNGINGVRITISGSTTTFQGF